MQTSSSADHNEPLYRPSRHSNSLLIYALEVDGMRDAGISVGILRSLCLAAYEFS